MAARVKAGQTVKAKVVSAAPHGIHLAHGDIEILVHVSDVEWGEETSPREYAKIGDELDVKILRFVDGDSKSAAGWLPWPSKKKSVSR